MSAIRGYEQLLAALNALRARWRRRKLAERLLLTAAGLAALAAAAALVDNVLQPGRFIRVALLVGLLAGTAVLAVRRVVRYLLEERRDDFFAALVEEKHPPLRNRLISAYSSAAGTRTGTRRCSSRGSSATRPRPPPKWSWANRLIPGR